MNTSAGVTDHEPAAVRNYSRKQDMETLTITKRQFEAALLRWTQDARDGKPRTHGEADSMPVEHVAAESAAHLWAELSATASALMPKMSEPTEDRLQVARIIAAQCWCDDDTKDIPIDPALAEAFARRILVICAKAESVERRRCVEVLQVTRPDLSLAAGELTEQEWRTCKGLLRLLQYRIGAPGSDITFARSG